MKCLGLILVFAVGCGNGQLRSEIAELRVSVGAMEARLAKVETNQVPQHTPVLSRESESVAEPEPIQESSLDVADKFQLIADKVCDCKDVPCAEAALKTLETLNNEDEPSAPDMERIEKSMGEMMECMTELAMAAANSAP